LADGVRGAGPTSDVFSFGVLSYELLANRLPHAGPPVLERLAGRPAPAAISLAVLRPDLPSELSAIIDRCIVEAPAQRPSAELVAAVISRVRLPS
jgi:serine/threonine-protein kinase